MPPMVDQSGGPTAAPNLRDSPQAIAGFHLYARFVSVDPTTNRSHFYSLTWHRPSGAAGP